MHKLRSILAVMFAILIASPACCCLAASPPVKEASHSCCGGEQKEKKESLCDCSVKGHAIAEADKPVPPAPATPLPPVPEAPLLLIADLQPLVTYLPVASYVDTGPPTLRLEILQRFLI